MVEEVPNDDVVWYEEVDITQDFDINEKIPDMAYRVIYTKIFPKLLFLFFFTNYQVAIRIGSIPKSCNSTT